MTTIVIEAQQPAQGEYDDRKRTLPRRILKLCLRLAALTPGRYVFIVDVPERGELAFDEATLRGYRQT